MLYGCLPSKIDVRDYELCSSNVGAVSYPDKFELNDLPRVKYQGNVNSCCAHATSSILEYYDKNRHNLSTNFLYGIQKKLFNQCKFGMYLSQACEIVQKYGDMLEDDCKGNDEIPKCYSIAERSFDFSTNRNRAFEYRIDSYYLCLTDNDIKFALMNYGPVLGAIMWHDNFTLDKDNIINFDEKSDKGGHAVVIVGWDKDKGWLIQNSWGDWWGDKGRFWLPFEYGFYEARAMIDHPNEEDEALVKPHKHMPNWIAVILNFILNLFKKRK